MTCKDEGGRKKKTDPKANMIAEVILTLTFISFSEQKKYIKGMEVKKDVYYNPFGTYCHVY